MSRRRNSAAAFISGLAGGMALGQKWKESSERSALRKDLADVSNVRETAVASGDEAQKAGMDAYNMALSAAATPEERARVEQDFKPTLSALESRKASPAAIAYSVGTGQNFRQQAEPFDPNQLAGAKTQARADIYSRHGREDDAARVLTNEQRRRALADDAAVRDAFNPHSNANMLANSPTDLADAIHGNAVPTSTSGPASVIAKTGIPGARNELDWYLKEQAPKITQALLRGGHVEQAKQFTNFLESREGYAYAKSYTAGLRRWAVGDNEGAIRHFEKLYNDDMYPDGRKVKLTPLEGDQLRIDQVDAEGKVLNSKTGSLADLTKQAALMLNPMQAVQFIAQQNAKREGEAATLDRQMQLEQMRQQGREVAEDRRDARLVKQIEAANARHAQGGGLTAAQQRSNFEIDAAREMVAGLSDDDIRQRTAPTTATGRENPLFDPALARAAKLASRRKIGDDPDFDARTGRQSEPPVASPQPAPAKPAGGDDIAKRFRANRQFDSYKLGKPATVTTKDGRQVNGVEVLDKNGKVVGYFE